MSLRSPLLLFLTLSVAIGFTSRPQWAQSQPSSNTAPPVCAVTIPNQSEPPVKNFGSTVAADYTGPQDNSINGSYGNGKLWTQLWPDGTVIFRPGGPGFVLSDGSLSMKFPWWRGVHGKLTIQGRRLDEPAPPLRAKIPEGYSDTGFQATELIFPAEGCWEVSGKVGDTSLTFVTRVVRIRDHK